MDNLCGSAVVKFKSYVYQMTNGREIMIVATLDQTKHKWWKNNYTAEILKWHLFISKSEAAMSMET